jgi:hypothetical protein
MHEMRVSPFQRKATARPAVEVSKLRHRTATRLASIGYRGEYVDGSAASACYTGHRPAQAAREMAAWEVAAVPPEAAVFTNARIPAELQAPRRGVQTVGAIWP